MIKKQIVAITVTSIKLTSVSRLKCLGSQLELIPRSSPCLLNRTPLPVGGETGTLSYCFLPNVEETV